MSEYEGPQSKALINHQTERACAQLLGLISGITADGQLHDLEIQFLRTWLAQNRRANEHWLGGRIAVQLDAALADGHISDAERTGLLQTLQGAVGVEFVETGCVTSDPIAFPVDDCEVSLNGAVACLTGKFHFGTRGDCEKATAAAGAVCVDSVTKKLTYLVIGSAGATASWKQASYGNKIDAAMKLKENGHPVCILDEDGWRRGLAPRAANGAV